MLINLRSDGDRGRESDATGDGKGGDDILQEDLPLRMLAILDGNG